jgi:dipeptidyl aminopeptidase/acylaminoacyl peptidase
MKKRNLILFVLTLFVFTSVYAQNIDTKKLSIEDFYKVKSPIGKKARNIKFSENSRYLSYLWNPYDEFSYDLFVYDLKTGRKIRVTSLNIMKRFETPENYKKFIEKEKQKREEDKIQQEKYYLQKEFLEGKKVDLSKFEKKEIQELKKELEKKEKELEKKSSVKNKKKGKTEKDKKDLKNIKKQKKEIELWELRDKLKKRKEKEKVKRSDLYPGVSNYVWSEKSSELIFEYNGDLYRYLPKTNKIIRLTMTDERERVLSYTKDGKGYYYMKGNNVYKVLFGSSYIQQINHKIEKEKDEKKGFRIEDTIISPNDKWMIVIASKRKGAPAYKNVEIMSFKKRFSSPFKVKRQTTEMKRNEPEYRFYLRRIGKINYGEQPEPIFTIPGGDIWYEFSEIHWSKDSKYFAFMTWEREKGDLKIWLGNIVDKKPKILFKMKETIGYKSNYYNNIRFTPDSKKLIAILFNKEGFRQPFIFDLNTRAKRELIKGKFESFPIIGFSKNGRYFYVISDKQNPAMFGVYRVDIKSGNMKNIGLSDGAHRASAVSKNGKWLASVFGNWSSPPELYLINTTNHRKKTLTKSHSPELAKINILKPELFTYKNRHGDTIHGMIFKPFGWKPTDKRPAIIYLYGGPLGRMHTVEVDDFSSLSYFFQMFMALKYGYVAIDIDPRGQSGYGKKFNEANWKHPGKPQTEDLEDLVKHIKTGFGVDTKRLGLHGWSFGGFQTLYTMLTSPDTFSCGISAAPPTQWENYNSWYTGATIGKSVRGKLTMRKYSLIPLAKNLKKPLLMVHGMVDPNVLYQDTVNMYRAFLEAGKESLVDLFLDPEGQHGLRGVVKNKSTFKKFSTWFAKHLGKVN